MSTASAVLRLISLSHEAGVKDYNVYCFGGIETNFINDITLNKQGNKITMSTASAVLRPSQTAAFFETSKDYNVYCFGGIETYRLSSGAKALFLITMSTASAVLRQSMHRGLLH